MKPIKNTHTTVVVPFSVPVKLFNDFTKYCKKCGINKSKIVTDAIINFMNKTK